jgi:hypothetical protein
LIHQFHQFTALVLDDTTVYPYALRKNTSIEDEASFIAHPDGRCLPCTVDLYAAARMHASAARHRAGGKCPELMCYNTRARA